MPTVSEAREALDTLEQKLAVELKLTYPDPREELFARFIWPSAREKAGEEIQAWRDAYDAYLEALWPEHVTVTGYSSGPFAIQVSDPDEADPAKQFLVVQDNGAGFISKQDALDYLRHFIRSRPDPFVGGLKFHVIHMVTQRSFRDYCSW